MKKTDPAKPYRVLRQFDLAGTIYNRIDKPLFTEKQVAAIAKKHGPELPIEEIPEAAVSTGTPAEESTTSKGSKTTKGQS